VWRFGRPYDGHPWQVRTAQFACMRTRCIRPKYSSVTAWNAVTPLKCRYRRLLRTIAVSGNSCFTNGLNTRRHALTSVINTLKRLITRCGSTGGLQPGMKLTREGTSPATIPSDVSRTHR
jgi:hypothetical protein